MPIALGVNVSVPRQPRSLFLVVAATSTMALLLLGLAGTRARYVGDDYYFAQGVRDRGFWGVQLHFYKTWSGRVASSFIQAALKFLGPWTAAALPAFILAFWVLGAWVLVHTVDHRDRLPRTAKLALASSYVAINIFSAPNLFQTLFWQSGSPNYSVPQMLIPWLVATMVAKRSRRARHLGAAMLAFFLAATSEPAVVVCLLVLGTFALAHRSKRLAYVAPLIGSVIALLVVALAPGNNVRQTAIFQTRTLVDNMILGFVQWLAAASAIMVSHPWSFFGAVAFGLSCAQLARNEGGDEGGDLPIAFTRLRPLLLAGVALTVAIPITVFTLFAFLTGSPIPARGVPIVLNPMLLGVGLFAFALGVNKPIVRTRNNAAARPFVHRGLQGVRGSTLGLALVAVIASAARLPAEFAGGASLVQTTESIRRQFESKDTRSIEMPMLVGGVFFASPEDLRDPHGYWGERFASTGIRYVVTDTELWSSPHCRIC